MKRGWRKVEKRSWVGSSKGTQLPRLQSPRQAAVLQGLADLLEMYGSPQHSQGMAANEPGPQLREGEYLPLQLAACLCL